MENRVNSERGFVPLLRPKTLALLGAVAASSFAVGAGFGHLEKKSGNYTMLSTNEAKANVYDDKFVVGSWNMYEKPLDYLAETRELIDKYNVDVMMMQEVSRRDAEGLARTFDEWNVGFVLAERVFQKPDQGGFGNVIMTKAKQERPKGWSIPAESLPKKAYYFAAGFVRDGVDIITGEAIASSRAKEGIQDQRSMAVVDLGLGRTGGDQQKIRMGTTHISGQDRIDDRQLDNVVNIAEKNAKDPVPLVICGDLNNPPSIVARRAHDSGFRVPRAGHTTVDSKITTDYCFFKTAGKMSLNSFVVDRKFVTDHYPIVATFDIPRRSYHIRQPQPYNLRP